MSKLSVAEAAVKFKVSKEAIHNRIRRGSLDCVIEHGVKYVLLDEPSPQEHENIQKINDKYYSYIEDENLSLKTKIKELEEQNTSLRDQKEKMLIQEKEKIEQIYKDRDEQLKQVLQTISTKFIAHMQDESISEVPIETVVDVHEMHDEPIRLKDFLKLKDYKPAKRQRIKNRFKRLVGSDERVFRRKGKIYVNPLRYDYKDLISD